MLELILSITIQTTIRLASTQRLIQPHRHKPDRRPGHKHVCTVYPPAIFAVCARYHCQACICRHSTVICRATAIIFASRSSNSRSGSSVAINSPSCAHHRCNGAHHSNSDRPVRIADAPLYSLPSHRPQFRPPQPCLPDRYGCKCH